MNCRKFSLQMIGVALLMLFLTACGPSQSASRPVSPTLTPTPVPPKTTPLPPISTPLPLTAATVIATRGNQEWDLVVMGDSLTADLWPRYAAYLEQDLGVSVKTHTWMRGGCASACLLKYLRTNPELQQSIREAEVVVFDVGMAGFQDPSRNYAYGPPGTCGGTDNQDCLREALKVYQEDTDAIFAEIVSLCSPSETLIRTMDTHHFRVRELKEAEAFDVVNNYWREANGHLIQVATEHHIPVARIYAAFMGSNGDDDPRDKGLVQHDSIHPTGEGFALMAELFRELGYEYAP